MYALSEQQTLPPIDPVSLRAIEQFEACVSHAPQVEVLTQHVLHGGMYSRTVLIPRDVVITGAFIKVPTILFVKGDCTVWSSGQTTHLSGYQIIPASANRKQIFVAHEDTYLTMIFATTAKTIEDAEIEFTDQVEQLASRLDPNTNTVIITGE